MTEGEHIRVRVTSGARKEKISRAETGVWHITVREPAARGLANARVRALLAEVLGIETKHLRLVKGAQSPSKVYLVYR